MIQQESWLHQLVLTIFIKEQAHNIAHFITILYFQMMLLCKCTRLIQRFYFIKVNTCISFYSIFHRNSRERLCKVDIHATHSYLCGTQHILCHRTDKVLRQVNHTIDIRICLIQFQLCKFRIVLGIHAFIAENTANFVHFVKPADNQTFQIKLQCNTQIQIHVQRVVVCDKRSCCRTAGDRVQHRCFHF